jgi:hypothetical protein
VSLFNFEDLTIFGAGSEWFWAMLTLLALPVTYLAIRHQLHAQRAANAFEQLTSLTDEWLSERMRHVRLRLSLGLRHGGDPEETELLAGKVDHFFRKLELLHRHGYLETELLWTNFGEDVVRYWTVMADLIDKTRTNYESPGEFAEFEVLMRHMRDIMAKRGFPPFETDPASINGRLDWIIQNEIIALRIEQELKSGAIPKPPAISEPETASA